MISSREIEEELLAHIEARAEDLQRRGMGPEEALRRARVELGGVARFVEEGREAKGLRWWDAARGSLSAAWRGMRRRPGQAAATVGALGLAIGAAALVFAAARATLWNGLPYPAAERLYNVRLAVPAFTVLHEDLPVTARHFFEWRRGCGSCEAAALIDGNVYGMAGRHLYSLEVTPEFWTVTGLRAQAGRLFGAAGEVVLTDRAWREWFGGDGAVVGREIELNGERVRVTGVLEAGALLPRGEQLGELMRFAERVDVVRPLRAEVGEKAAADRFQWAMVVKLREGATREGAEAEMGALARRLEMPTTAGQQVRLTPLAEQMAGPARRGLEMLAWAAGLVALLAGINFGNLQWAGLAARRREIGIRAAMGASLGDLLRHSLAEALALAGVASGMGLLLAWAGWKWLAAAGAAVLPRAGEAGLDVAGWGAATALVAGPGVVCLAWQMVRGWRDPWWRSLRLGTVERSGDGPGERRVMGGLVFAAAAASVALTSVAGLLVVSYARLRGEDPGFVAGDLSVLCVTAPAGQGARHEALLERVRGLAGVRAAATANRVPLAGDGIADPVARVDGRGAMPMAAWRAVSPGYFSAVGTELLAGRDFVPADRGARVVILSARAARELFGGAEAVGQSVLQDGAAARVIGVAEEAKGKRVDAPAPPLVYFPEWQLAGETRYYVVRGTDVVERVRAAAEGMGMQVPAERTSAMEWLYDLVTMAPRWQTAAAVGLAAVGVLVTSLGLFAVVTFTAGRRMGEVGLRMAMGATRRQAARALVGVSLRPVAWGVAAGVVAGGMVGRLVAPHLYGLAGVEPWVLAGAGLAVLAPAVLAAQVSVWRAVRRNPVEALRGV